MSERRILVESMVIPPDQWQKEWVTAEGLRESVVAPSFDQFTQLLEQEKNEQLIEYWRGNKDSILHELTSQGKRLRVTGPGQVENLRNQNGRVYPTALWDRVLSEGSAFRKRLKERAVLGELEHPESGNTRLHGHNNLGLSHLVEDVQRKDGTIFVTHTIFNTPAGQILKEYFDNGISVPVSSRGSGNTRKDGDSEIVEAADYELDTWDFVYLPSVATARTRPVESLQTTHGSKIFLVPIVESKTMSTVSLKESSDRTARARVVLESSGQYLNNKDVSLAGLLEHSHKISDVLASLGTITESEFVADVAGLRGSLSQRAEEITRRIKTVQEGIEIQVTAEEDKPGEDLPAPPPPVTKPDMDLEDEDVAETLKKKYQSDRGLRERYRTAIRLGDTLVERSRKMKKELESKIQKLQSQLLRERKRSDASAKLLEAVVRRYRGEQVTQFIEGLVAKHPSLKSIQKRLGECQTVKQVKGVVEGIVAPLIKGGNKYPSDLPPLTEDGQKGPARKGASQPTNLMESLVRKK